MAEAVIAELTPLQAEYKRLQGDPGYLRQVVDAGAEQARLRAAATLADVYSKVGLDA